MFGTDDAGGVSALAGAIGAEPGFPPAFGLWGGGASRRWAEGCGLGSRAGIAWITPRAGLDAPAVWMEGLCS